jgi:DNA-directed RNA polymerase specialized sigma24 family protein
MTHDDLKNVLRQKQRLDSLKERIVRLRFGAEYPLRRLGEMSANSDMRDKLAEDVAKIIDLERELALQVLSYEGKAAEIERELDSLPENQATVLRLRYCDGLPWKKVSDKAGYSISHCKDLNTKFVKTRPNQTI